MKLLQRNDYFTRRQLNALSKLEVKTKDESGIMRDRDNILNEAHEAIRSIEDGAEKARLRSEILGLYERRSLEIAGDLQMRAEIGKTKKLKGYPILFNVPTTIWGDWKEQIAPEAVEGVNFGDSRLLVDHDTSQLLARAGINLKVAVEDLGVYIEAEMPNTQLATDTFELISRGIMDGMSFCFYASKIETDWDSKLDTIKKFKEIPEFSVVTFPAYPQTVVVSDEGEQENSASKNEEEYLPASEDEEKEERERKLKLLELF